MCLAHSFCQELAVLYGSCSAARNDSLVGGVACGLLSYGANMVMAICIYIIQNVWYFIVSLYFLFFYFFYFLVFTLYIYISFYFYFLSVYSLFIFIILFSRSTLF